MGLGLGLVAEDVVVAVPPDERGAWRTLARGGWGVAGGAAPGGGEGEERGLGVGG